MIKFIELKDYSFLKILKKKFSNPPKVNENGHVVLKIDNNLYHSVIDDNYQDYINILKDIHHELGYDFYFQKYPNFRFNDTKDEYPVWHSDSHFNHHDEEINIMIPITKEEFGFEIITCKYLKFIPFRILNTKLFKFIFGNISKKINYLDDILVFSGYYLHTASNRSEFKNPRLSIDFRLLPLNHKRKYKKSLRGIPLKPGHYFSDKSISEYV